MLASSQALLGNGEAIAFVYALRGRSVSIITEAVPPHRHARDIQ